MGDDIELKAIEVIQDGLFQMDFWNNTKNEGYRVFVKPDELFSMIGVSMQRNHEAHIAVYIAEGVRAG